MAKAQFQKGQRVWVEVVGLWAVIEKVAPVWAKGFDEPVRVLYDVGLGREFSDRELKAESRPEDRSDSAVGEWRLLRARNKWQSPEDCAHHPFPGSFPVVVTDAQDWGGWRTPGAEYDRDPNRIELQARAISATPKLMALARDLLTLAQEDADHLPAEVVDLARRAGALLRRIHDVQPAAVAGGERAA